MRFSEQWLREWINPPVDSAALAHQLTMAGLEVDAVEPAAPGFSGVVVGRVLSVAPHPDAERLQICQVDAGGGHVLTIVCGARNVAPGLPVPLALIDAVLPGGLKIKRSKLRGVESFGMLCSARELGLAETAEGLMILDDDALAGTDLRDYLKLNDHCIELGLTPNRGDCLSIAGIAREVAVLNDMQAARPEVPEIAPQSKATLPVEITARQDCARYVGRTITGINPQAKTPLWLQERLRRSGLRSLGPVVDVTNYVLLELGQPMHAFDLTRLDNGIKVRHALPGEILELLDGKEIALSAGTLIIADHARPVALAGVMGGTATAVNESTRDVFLESAFFNPLSIAGKAREYGLHTDSSHRFERGVDPAIQRLAMERATGLLLDIVGGIPGEIIEVMVRETLPTRQSILLRHEKVNSMLGIKITTAEITRILERLGMQVIGRGNAWEITPPGFRFDLTIEVDLIEELARIYGYNRIPVARPRSLMEIRPRPESRLESGAIKQLLVNRGYQEVITYSFVAPNLPELLTPGIKAMVLANPISADMSVMRTTLWAGLIHTLCYNLNRQQARVRIFEQGLKYARHGKEINQTNTLAGLICGSNYPEQWGEPSRDVDFYDLKGDVEVLLGLNTADEFEFRPGQHPALHPGKTAQILRNNLPVGWVGALHPEILNYFKISYQVFVFEIDYISISSAKRVPHYREMSRFPSIRRDIAVVVDDSVTAQSVFDCLKNISSDFLQELQLFDMFTGKGIDSGKKSLALCLILQHRDRTLTDDEVDTLVGQVVSLLEQQLDAKLRD